MPALIAALREVFRSDAVAPLRHAHQISPDMALLLMPAWRPGGRAGIKTTSVNAKASPSIQSSYQLLDGVTGRLDALIDGAMLTSRRTAAASALAAGYLARADAETLLMIGTGTLVPHLIEAHAAVRPIRRVLLWGRDVAKAEALAPDIAAAGFAVEVVLDLDAAVPRADIVSAATLSTTALIHGAHLAPGTHVDLVGAFKPEMCEADPETFRRARLFADIRHGVLEEAGDVLQAIAAGAIDAQAIEAELADLCAGRHTGRDDAGAITLFKSVGSSLEDLAAAELVVAGWHEERVST